MVKPVATDNDLSNPESTAFYKIRIGLAAEILHSELARLRQAVEAGRISLCGSILDDISQRLVPIDIETGLLVTAQNKQESSQIQSAAVDLRSTDSEEADLGDQDAPLSLDPSTEDEIHNPDINLIVGPEGSEADTQPEPTFEELYLDSLTTLATEKRVAAGDVMTVNIGAIVRTIYGGNTSPENFHNIIQWINHRPEFVSQNGSVYELVVPGEPETEAVNEVVVSESMLCVMRVQLKDRTPGAVIRLHVNQVIGELKLNGAKRKAIAQQIASQVQSIPIRWMKRDGTFYDIYLTDDADTLAEAIAERGANLDPHRITEPESFANPDVSQEQLLSYFVHQIERDIIEVCTAKVGPRVIDLRKRVASVTELSPEDYDEFTKSQFEAIRNHIVDTLNNKEIVATWEITGNTRGRRYRLVVPGLISLDDPIQVTRSPIDRLPVEVENTVTQARVLDASTIDLVRIHLSKYRGSGQHKKGTIVRDICDDSSLDPEIVQSAIKTLVEIGFADQSKNKGSVYLRIM